MEQLDEQEFNPSQDVTVPTRVIQDKRKKLLHTLEKVGAVVEKENPESYGEFKQMVAHYESRRQQRQLYYGML